MARGYKTGGRQVGTKNSDGSVVAKHAAKYAKRLIDELFAIATTAPEKGARVAAAKEILDRGLGRPTQMIGGDKNAAPIKIVLQGTDKEL